MSEKYGLGGQRAGFSGENLSGDHETESTQRPENQGAVTAANFELHGTQLLAALNKLAGTAHTPDSKTA